MTEYEILTLEMSEIIHAWNTGEEAKTLKFNNRTSQSKKNPKNSMYIKLNIKIV
jgi:hypothetical protein